MTALPVGLSLTVFANEDAKVYACVAVTFLARQVEPVHPFLETFLSARRPIAAYQQHRSSEAISNVLGFMRSLGKSVSANERRSWGKPTAHIIDPLQPRL
jgi:hypothetical protein